MHNNCGEIFSGFCRKPVRISEFFRDQAETEKGHEGGGVAEVGQKGRRRGRSH